MLCALQPPTPMQQDIKPSLHLSHTHDYSTSAHSHYKASLSSSLSRYSPPESPRHLPSFFTNGVTPSADTAMSGSSGHGHSQSQHLPPSSIHHRGLPPPTGSGFALPPPTPTSTDPHHRPSSAAPQPPPQPPPPPSQHQSHTAGGFSLGQLPAPPPTWSSAVTPSDDSMRSWLHAKAEEDRRRQEEEKTTQEKVRLEQRRLERDMLRESLDRGIPPAMVPLIFAGLGAGNGVGVSQAIEFAQNWMQGLTLQQQQQLVQVAGGQTQQQQLPSSEQQRIAYEQQLRHQQSISSPDLRREREREQQAPRDRMIPSNPYASQQQQPLPSQSQQPPPLSNHRSSFSTAGPATAGALSKLNTVDFTPSGGAGAGARQGLHPSLSAGNLSTFTREGLRDEPSASTASGTASGQGSGAGLFFHHWTPPTGTGTGQGSGGQPPTPSGKSMQGSPYGSQGSGTHGHLRKQQQGNSGPTAVSDWENSPKKRKMTHTSGGGSGSSGGSATRSAMASQGGTGATGAPLAASTAEEVESESTGSGRETEREGREPLRPSSRQQRLEEREGHAHAHPHSLGPPPPHHQQQHHPTSQRYDDRGPSG